MLRNRKAPQQSATDNHIQKFESSGLTIEDCQELGMEFLNGFETTNLGYNFSGVESIKLNYFDLDGNPMSAFPKWPQFYRVRYVEGVKNKDGKDIRYTQPHNTGVCAYFPKNIDWRSVASDTKVGILITEGEFKAAKTCREGYACIGLGGVWNFRSGPSGQAFLPHLNEIDWLQRRVYICYDSDFKTNPNIRASMDDLAEEVADRGGLVYVLSLPDVVEDGKTGLDDFFISEQGQDPVAFQALLNTAVPIGLAKPLWDMNKRVAFVKDPGIVIDQETNQKMSPAFFKEAAYASENIMETFIDSTGAFAARKASVAPVWMRWPLRNECNKLDYLPGEDKYSRDSKGLLNYNMWQGWGAKPEKGDTSLWHELLDHLFKGADKGAKEWFLDWCAYPIQFPGTKMFSAAVFFGMTHGTGKTLVGYTLGKIYGDNFIEIDQESLHDGRNDWAENRQFVLGDEITGSDKRQDADMLKRLITQKKITIDIKFIPAFQLTSRTNFMFTSNQPDAFFLEDTDRRYFIHEVLDTTGPLDEMFYADYDMWLAGNGANYLMHELLERDVGHFNPFGHAMDTSAKKRMKLDTQSDLGTWVRALMIDPDRYLRVGQIKIERDLVTNKELLRIYDPDGSRKLTANGLGREMRKAGAPMANNGLPFKTSLGYDRFYVMRDADKWRNATVKQCQDHVDGAEGQRVKKGHKI